MKATTEQKNLKIENLNSEKIAVIFERKNYNSKRYGKPWIATIASWDIGEHVSLAFGSSGKEEAEASAKVGDIIKCGQKDNRKNYSENYFRQVGIAGELLEITEAQAREVFRL